MAFGPRIRILAVAGGVIALAAALPAAASPLDKETCDKLRAEKQSLTGMGVEKDMAKGADWAKTNMKPAQLEQVKRYISVDEQLKFRCQTAIAEARAKAKDARIKAAKEAKAAKHAKAAASTAATAESAPQAKATGQAKAKAKTETAPAADAPDDKKQE